MSVFKCKMCGGTLEINNSETVAVCEYCGTKQTMPKANSEVITNLFNRANNLRLKCEFDKASLIYEKIIEQDTTEAEAYWGLVLCKYGIEYVEDQKELKRVPTCHRTLYESVTSDVDYQAAILHADLSQRLIYEEEARVIEYIQKDILDIVKNEEPFDVFICYKETDEVGKRTVDSVIANDIYHELTEEGFKVFYSAITLETKLGQEYEPYIFAALTSAKVMLVIGTKPEYFEAVWVKNEWGRYLKLMKSDRSKLLIPCYKDMDAYELPEEFAHFQAQNMGKIGFINDVIRGIKKVLLEKHTEQNEKEKLVVNAVGASEEPLLKRAFMFLEDGEFERADEFCEQVLNLNPENAKAYLGKLMAELRVRKKEHLGKCDKLFDTKNNYEKVIRFADKALVSELKNYIKQINQRNKDTQIKETYARAKANMTADTIPNLYDAIDLYNKIIDFRDSREMISACEKRIAELRKEQEERHKNDTYSEALNAMDTDYIPEIERAITIFETIIDWKDSRERIAECKSKIEELEIEAERKAKRGKIAGIVFMTVIVGAILLGILFGKVIIPNSQYKKAIKTMKNNNYDDAIAIFEELGNYKESKEYVKKTKYDKAMNAMEEEKFDLAYEILYELGNYEDCSQQLENIKPYVRIALIKYAAEVGDTVLFGKYEQDNDTSNGQEEIEWIVLKKDGDKVLLHSKYALDFQPYSTDNTDYWENSYLRQWLNSDFINTAFSAEQQAYVQETTISNNYEFSEIIYESYGGPNTVDKIFIFSADEIKKYKKYVGEFEPTEFALKKDSNYTQCGWLRSPKSDGVVATLKQWGTLDGRGIYGTSSCYVMPALWINVDSILE